ncbi:MAG TPA: hypothetical protein VL097_09245 [Rhodanobacter sp.]|nr:hypothetical protein [Rhodanobacter sp.]
MARNRYYIAVADLARARGVDQRFAWTGVDPQDFAGALQRALRTDELFGQWRAVQDDPEAVDEAIAASDPEAAVSARVADLHTEVELVTDLPMRVVRHRLNMLIGPNWTLRDMRAA